MSKQKETERLVTAYLQGLPTPERAALDERTLKDALTIMEKTIHERPAPAARPAWQRILATSGLRIAVATAILAAIMLFVLFNRQTRPVWALSDTIEAIRGFGAVHMAGIVMDEYGDEKGIKLWMRANKSGTGSKEAVARLSHGVVQWVQDGGTYTYIPQNNTLYHEDAITAGTAQWLGPELLDQFRNAAGSQVLYGTDPRSGRRRVTLLCSIYDALGPQSFSIDFDLETKLPVAMTVWNNLERRGAPGFSAREIIFYPELPDSVFSVDYPANARRVEKDLTIPESAMAFLIDPRCGISAEGMSLEVASREILSQLYQAIRDGDLNLIRRLCPALSAWNDDLVKALLMGPSQRPVQVVEIRPICKQGNSRIGPLVAVPVIIRTQSGIMREDKIIIQFRNISGASSCVVYGPYGQPREIE
jgi:hypothetical protein